MIKWMRESPWASVAGMCMSCWLLGMEMGWLCKYPEHWPYGAVIGLYCGVSLFYHYKAARKRFRRETLDALNHFEQLADLK